MDLNNLSMFEAFLISIVGFATVFIILCVIMVLVNISAKIIKNFESKKVESKPTETNAPIIEEAVASENNTNDLQIIIAAAVAAYFDNNGSCKFVIRDIRKVNNYETPWISSSKMNNFNRG